MAQPTIVTPYATLSFPVLFAPKPRAEKGDPEYSCALLFDEAAQRSPEYKAMQQAVVKAMADRWGPTMKVEKLYYTPFSDAGEKADKYQGYEEGIMVINPHSKQKPGVIDARKQDVLLPEQVYAGQLVRAAINAFAWENSGKRGVSFGLQHVQIVKHDAPRIDGKLSAGKVFDDLPDEYATVDEEIPF
jgi:hypothetical protein